MNNVNDWLGFDPFTEMGSFRDAMRQFFEAGGIAPRNMTPAAIGSVLVPIDVLDAGPELIVRANLPGVKPADVSITLIGNTLTLKGECKPPVELEGAIYLRHERRATVLTRAIELPMEVDADSAHADTQDGVLTLTLPKIGGARPKTIRVKQETA